MPFAWSPEASRYRDLSTGRFLPEQRVRRALDAVVDVQAVQMRALSQQLLDGTLSLRGWQFAMMAEVKAAHVVGVSTAVGGWNQMSDLEWTKFARQEVRRQYRYLDRFARDIAAGRQPLNGTLLSRSELYAHAGRQTHRAAQSRLATQRGMEQEANRLGAADHCAGCLSQTSRGWVRVGSLVPCGSRDCRVRCHCSLMFRTRPAA